MDFRSPVKQAALCVILLIGLNLAVFGQVVGHEFIGLDDDDYILENPFIADGITTDSIIWSIKALYSCNWHPLTWMSHALDIEIWGFRAGGHLMTNLLLHIVSSIVLFSLLKTSTKGTWPAFFVAALFAVHPLHVESVAWASERKDVLCGLFWFLTMRLYVQYAQKKSLFIYLAVAFCLAAALASKPMAVTLPFVLLLMDFWPSGRTRFGPPAASGIEVKTDSAIMLIAEKLPLFILVAASILLTVAAQDQCGAIQSFQRLPLAERLSNAALSYWRYLFHVIRPIGPVVPYPYGSVSVISGIAAGLLLAVVSLLAFLKRNRLPYVFFGWFLYVGVLVPVIGVIQVGAQAMADRYTYIPLTGIFIIIVFGVVDWCSDSGPRARIAAFVGAGILTVSALAGFVQTGFWKDPVVLFRHSVQASDNNCLAHFYLGNALFKYKRFEEALTEFKRAAELCPRQSQFQNNLGNVYNSMGRYDLALEHYSETVRMSPDDYIAHYNLGTVLGRLGRLDSAVFHLEEALRLNPGFQPAVDNLKKARKLRDQVRAD